MADDTDEEDDRKPAADGVGGARCTRDSREVFGPGQRTSESPADMLRGHHNNNIGSELGRSFQTTSHGTVRSTDGSPSVAVARNIAGGRPSAWQSGNFDISDVEVATLTPSTRFEKSSASGTRGCYSKHSKKRADGKSEFAVNNYKTNSGAVVKGVIQYQDKARQEKFGESTGEEVQIADGPFRCGPWSGNVLKGKWLTPKPTTLACCCQPRFSIDKSRMEASLRQIDASTEKHGHFNFNGVLEPIKIEVEGEMKFAVCHKILDNGSRTYKKGCGLIYDQDGDLVFGSSSTGESKDARYIKN